MNALKLISIGLLAFLLVSNAQAQSGNTAPARDTIKLRSAEIHALISLNAFLFKYLGDMERDTVLAFEVSHISRKTGDAANLRNKTVRFETRTQELFGKAEPGDTYIISNVIAFSGSTKKKVVVPLIVLMVQ